MKEKYENLTDFINDILEAAELASKEMTDDLGKDENKCDKKCKKEYIKPECKDNSNNIDYSYMPKSVDNSIHTIPANINIDDNNHFILNEMVNGWPTYGEQHLIFEQMTEDGYKIPGITEAQLLSVLYHRYKDDPKKLALIRELMN